ncbi:histamine H2 receptor-like [Strongylocentrotus purpuratus]|uniref:G-protein coupled receptors family 1 profile domain-containing protein n=1 Tax=Strongylocentrotus purpuratus TaxID=7668 RepID=A0A7M7SX32_STRPU|nr:histamine H2 receptor-like [Strongylocentrotus purpuratus]|eukprot:XP_011681776.1 PREDICTED: histamine H2 receptor-like [Strongylocentrotus purpuratus]
MNSNDGRQPVIVRMGETAAGTVATGVSLTYASLAGGGNSTPGYDNLTELDPNSTSAADLPPYTLDLGQTIGLAFVFGIIILTTLVGNILVCLSPLLCHRLRTATYTFLISLAVADLLLGITVLPFSAYNTLKPKQWIFTPIYCNIYVSCDVMFSTSSILHLLLISLDRYVAITRPYAYQRNMNRKKAYASLAVVWTISLLISFLPLHLGWNTEDGKVQNYENPRICGLDSNRYYALFDGIVLFFIPLIVMSLVYIRLVFIANRQARAIQKLMISSHNETSEERANRRRSVDEHRALKIIAIVMGAFVVCWVPYFTQFTFRDVGEWVIHPVLFEVLLWLGYLNSLINPVVYACMNREFRRAFKRLLSCMRWKPLDDTMDSRYYTTQHSRCTGADSKNGVRYSASSNHPTTGNGSNNYTLQLPIKKNGIYMKLFRSSSRDSSTRPQPT